MINKMIDGIEDDVIDAQKQVILFHNHVCDGNGYHLFDTFITFSLAKVNVNVLCSIRLSSLSEFYFHY